MSKFHLQHHNEANVSQKNMKYKLKPHNITNQTQDVKK